MEFSFFHIVMTTVNKQINMGKQTNEQIYTNKLILVNKQTN